MPAGSRGRRGRVQFKSSHRPNQNLLLRLLFLLTRPTMMIDSNHVTSHTNTIQHRQKANTMASQCTQTYCQNDHSPLLSEPVIKVRTPHRVERLVCPTKSCRRLFRCSSRCLMLSSLLFLLLYHTEYIFIAWYWYFVAVECICQC